MGKVVTSNKKASVSTELVLGQAAQQITKAVAEMAAASATLTKLTAQADDLTLLVANKEDQIAALEVEFAEKARQAKVNLEVSMKANTDSVVNTYLSENGKVAITKTELTNLNKELTDIKASAEAETKKQVAIVTNTLSTQYANDKRFVEAENKALAAETTAKLNALIQNEKNLQAQVENLFEQLNAERNAGIERAKAGSIGTINVSSERK